MKCLCFTVKPKSKYRLFTTDQAAIVWQAVQLYSCNRRCDCWKNSCEIYFIYDTIYKNKERWRMESCCPYRKRRSSAIQNCFGSRRYLIAQKLMLLWLAVSSDLVKEECPFWPFEVWTFFFTKINFAPIINKIIDKFN